MSVDAASVRILRSVLTKAFDAATFSSGLQALDGILPDGGIAPSSIFEIFGPPCAGKTFLTRRAVAIALQSFSDAHVVILHTGASNFVLGRLADLGEPLLQRLHVYCVPTAFELLSALQHLPDLCKRDIVSSSSASILVVVDSLVDILHEDSMHYPQPSSGYQWVVQELRRSLRVATDRLQSQNFVTSVGVWLVNGRAGGGYGAASRPYGGASWVGASDVCVHLSECDKDFTQQTVTIVRGGVGTVTVPTEC